MKTIWKRLASETPKFWNKLAFYGGMLTIVSAGIIGAPDDIAIPQFLRDVASYLATAGFVATLLAKATTTDTELSEK
ncbi:MAG TPA: hypothetical protein VNQ80_15485 [Parapedobacter sp.]|uniref:hypothetical protein n=1 Tax=Parapedobacter sp. TaxID=1958893 RepID=UPI002BB44015|nr:hypothetical protein [Parapedobacter sp.]HWK58745.1 hypothetical protein [Parapedobacter sp.]